MRTLPRCARNSRHRPLPPVESTPELWPETVDSAKLLADLAKQIRRYVVIREEGLSATVTLHGDVLDPQRGRHAQPHPRRHVCRCLTAARPRCWLFSRGWCRSRLAALN